MLPPTNRLPKQRVADILRHGTRITTEELVFRYLKTNDSPRFAFVVSAKIDKRAVYRNRMRRMLSESVRRMLPRLTGTDGVFLVRKNFSGLSQQATEQYVVDLLGKARTL